MSKPSFTHLHLHTQYSVLDGANKISPLMDKAKAQGQKAVAMTDHGNMHGAIEFYTQAKSREIKPIIGCEVYYTPGSRFERKRKVDGGHPSNHLTLLAKDIEGYRNLCALVSLAYTEGFYFKPRIDFELLERHYKGLVCLSGCMSSQFGTAAKFGKEDEAEVVARKFRDLFESDYYLEVQPHEIEEQQTLNQVAKSLGQKLSIPLVATNDCHYLECDDHYAQEVLMCVSTGKLITDPDRIRHTGAHLHFKTRQEMLSEMPGFEEAIDQSCVIADKCNLELDFKTYHMPQFEPQEEISLEDAFVKAARDGLEERIPGDITKEKKQVYLDRLQVEIDLILKMGFAGYFLVVSDFVRWAKANDIPVGPGRGSAAGSLVAWVMRITDVDPIPYKLLFERFLNPERVSLPDIDIDFCIHGREKVIEYVTEKYGKDKVAQIVTFGTLKAKAAIKDVGRALGLSYAETDRVAKLIPAPRQGFDYPIDEALKMEKRLKEYAEGEGKELIELARKLEGLSRHTSTHAAGLVISDKPIVEYLPLMEDKDGQVVTQFSMNYVEQIGLVKFDFLGLKTLTVIHEACRMIKKGKGVDIDLEKLPLDDKRVFSLIASGRTIGVFQMESSGLTEMVGRLRPTDFEDIVAILALYRPGPLDSGMADHYINRKNGREEVSYLHPMLKPILKDTYGIILYQEQIMQIARDLAGYSLAQADMLRRAMGKKKPEEMARQREIFLEGAKANQISAPVAEQVFDQMETFARYGFNRSHSVAYALISYQTAWLKAHYPLYFLAALMSSEMGDTDKTLKNLNECKEMGVEILPPDVNIGEVGFSVMGKKILFGLAAIKSVGSKSVEELILERENSGEFKSLVDFSTRMGDKGVNRRAMENMVKAGAFDTTSEFSRQELCERVEDVLKTGARLREEAASNQLGLFAAQSSPEPDYVPKRPLLEEWPKNRLLNFEKEALGFYLSGHPLESMQGELNKLGVVSINKLGEAGPASLAGVITFLRLKNTKKGDRYATFTLEDLSGTIEAIVWPDTYNKVHQTLSLEEPVLIWGKVDASGDRRTIIVNRIEAAMKIRSENAREVVIVLRNEESGGNKFSLLKKALVNNKGACPVKLVIRTNSMDEEGETVDARSETVISLPPELQVAPSEALLNQVEQIFGRQVASFR